MSALGDLEDALKADVLARQSTTVVVMGDRKPARQIDQATASAGRVVIEPVIGNTVGELVAPLRHGGNPRNVVDLKASATIWVWAYDGSTPEAAASDRAQYDAVVSLLKETVSAIWRYAAGRYTMGKVERAKAGECLHGREVKFELTLRDPVSTTQAEAVVREPGEITTTLALPDGSATT